MPKNNTSSDYWRGYRAVRIYALMKAIEGYDAVKDDIDEVTNESEAFLTGFHAGIQKLRAELAKTLAYEKELERGK